MAKGGRVLGLVVVAALSACGGDHLSAPSRLADAVTTPSSKVYPAWQYKTTVLFPGTNSIAQDVNERNEIVGYLNGEGFFLPPGGPHVLLPHPGSNGANAVAVSTSAGIGGAVIRSNLHYPAYWPTPYSRPWELKGDGGVMDVNDLGDAVGHTLSKGIRRAFFWEPTKGSLTLLPRYATGNDDIAWAINNDRVIVGTSAGYPVKWRLGSTGWTVSRITGLFPTDIDAGYGTVGQDGFGHASYGNPDLAGTFPTQWLASTWATNARSVAVGEDWDPASGQMLAWVGDRFGGFTYLPFPANPPFPTASARGINSCGLVVGFLGSTFNAEAVLWDPGC